MPRKFRCSYCKNYVEDLFKIGVGGLSGVCSEECLDGIKKKYVAKRQRRQQHRESRRTTAYRLPGKCRDRVRRRDGNVCRWCGTNESLQIHHVRYRSEGGPDTPRNLITLCQQHHALAHTNKRKYQPVLLLWLWLVYEQEMIVTIESAFKLAGQHPEWVAAARSMSDNMIVSNTKTKLLTEAA